MIRFHDPLILSDKKSRKPKLVAIYAFTPPMSAAHKAINIAVGSQRTVNAVEKKFTDRKRASSRRTSLAERSGCIVPDWFETTGDSYFKHVNRTTIELAVAEAKGVEADLSVRAVTNNPRR